MSKISSVDALEILDSRGQPTIKAFVTTASGFVGSASVPSGASTGRFEAVELRDEDPKRFLGRSVSKAVKNVQGALAQLLVGLEVAQQESIDAKMVALDGTEDKSHLGANAILAVSLACARAAACEQNQPLYLYLRKLFAPASDSIDRWILPVPMLNILNGGVHADNNLDFQEFMIRPIAATSFSQALRESCEVYATLKQLLKREGFATNVGDEGGFAPQLVNDEAAIEYILKAIESSGYLPGRDFTLALDCAASELYEEGFYSEKKKKEGRHRSSQEQIELLALWQERYPIDSIEDGLAQEDWSGWQELQRRLGHKCQIVGDDIFVTNPRFLQKGIALGAAGAILIKPNQIGTLSETLHTIALAQEHRFETIISHRSGETEDSFIADLAVAVGSGQIKTGAPCRSERVAKYNRLLEIEAELGARAHLGGKGFRF